MSFIFSNTTYYDSETLLASLRVAYNFVVTVMGGDPCGADDMGIISELHVRHSNKNQNIIHTNSNIVWVHDHDKPFILTVKIARPDVLMGSIMEQISEASADVPVIPEKHQLNMLAIFAAALFRAKQCMHAKGDSSKMRSLNFKEKLWAHTLQRSDHGALWQHNSDSFPAGVLIRLFQQNGYGPRIGVNPKRAKDATREERYFAAKHSIAKLERYIQSHENAIISTQSALTNLINGKAKKEAALKKAHETIREYEEKK